jgi:hypothetical protein
MSRYQHKKKGGSLYNIPQFTALAGNSGQQPVDLFVRFIIDAHWFVLEKSDVLKRGHMFHYLNTFT